MQQASIQNPRVDCFHIIRSNGNDNVEQTAFRLLFAALLIAVLSACGGGSYEGEASEASLPPPAGSDASSIRGRSVYISQCLGCHESDGRGTRIESSLINCPSCATLNGLSTRIAHGDAVTRSTSPSMDTATG